MGFPEQRLRRLRRTATLRRMVCETVLHVDDLSAPLFIRPGANIQQPVASMPGVAQLSVDRAVLECQEIVALGIPAVMLFGIPEAKDAVGSSSWSDNGIIQSSLRTIRAACPDLILITDLCFCEYTDHGHCGVVATMRDGTRQLDNDATLENLARQAVSHARNGADVIAPSGMLDGMVATVRKALDAAGHQQTAILSYAAKFSSGYYGPFRDAAESAPEFGDRKGYQVDPANAGEALREVALDIEEGADMVMVKPALNYLDVLYRTKQRFDVPTAAYHVSGEYAMLKAAAQNGWLDEKRCALETVTSIKRAGADLIFTYFAKDIAGWLG